MPLRMDPPRDGFTLKTVEAFRSALGVNAAFIQLSAVVLQGVAILGGGSASGSTAAALYLSVVKSLAAEVVRLQPSVSSSRRRLAATSGLLALTDATTIASLLSAASASAVAAGTIPAASAPSPASISAVASAVATVNTAVAGLTASTSAAFLSAIDSLNGVAYVSSTSLLASVNALASGQMVLAAFSAATSATALATLISNTDIRMINSALYCSYLTSAGSVGGTLCASTSTPSSSSREPDSLTWIYPLVICTVVGLILLVLFIMWLIRRRRSELHSEPTALMVFENGPSTVPAVSAPAKQPAPLEGVPAQAAHSHRHRHVPPRVI